MVRIRPRPVAPVPIAPVCRPPAPARPEAPAVPEPTSGPARTWAREPIWGPGPGRAESGLMAEWAQEREAVREPAERPVRALGPDPVRERGRVPGRAAAPDRAAAS